MSALSLVIGSADGAGVMGALDEIAFPVAGQPDAAAQGVRSHQGLPQGLGTPHPLGPPRPQALEGGDAAAHRQRRPTGP